MKGVPQRTAQTLTTRFLRVPSVDWADIVVGRKTEVRTIGRYALCHWRVKPPELVVGYLVRRHEERRERLLIVEDAWSEPLGAISPESIANEGFESLDEFRSYWLTRHKWQPLATVQVAKLRPYVEGADRRVMEERVLQRVYGRWLP